jgi:hypothetical protein
MRPIWPGTTYDNLSRSWYFLREWLVVFYQFRAAGRHMRRDASTITPLMNAAAPQRISSTSLCLNDVFCQTALCDPAINGTFPSPIWSK